MNNPADLVFECNECNYGTQLYTDLVKHKLKHVGPTQNMDEEELFMNLIIKQQQDILRQIAITNRRLDKEFDHLRINQDHIYDSVKTLKTAVEDIKKEVMRTSAL